MRKKVKGLVGICLVAALAVGSVGRYAHAGSATLSVVDSNDNIHNARGYSSIGQTRGSAHTEAEGSSYCHCSVSATFRWYDSNGNKLYSNGNGAGGMHGAGVSMYYTGDSAAVGSANVSATHTVNVITGGYGWCTTEDSWD